LNCTCFQKWLRGAGQANDQSAVVVRTPITRPPPFRWLTERQFLDAVAVSMITPGPVVITVAFISYLVVGPVGATVAAIGVFAPVYFVTVLAAPHFRRLAESARIKAFVDRLLPVRSPERSSCLGDVPLLTCQRS